jgi:hypothetical protein
MTLSDMLPKQTKAIVLAMENSPSPTIRLHPHKISK